MVGSKPPDGDFEQHRRLSEPPPTAVHRPLAAMAEGDLLPPAGLDASWHFHLLPDHQLVHDLVHERLQHPDKRIRRIHLPWQLHHRPPSRQLQASRPQHRHHRLHLGSDHDPDRLDDRRRAQRDQTA
ncbi:MAG: hypothetical protein MZU95_14340 [Desulfomicrobium escambiense]|nr:hypothetical protein [Desulfomicrobium escambiense]